MSYSYNCLKGVIWGIIKGIFIGVRKEDPKSLDYSSYRHHMGALICLPLFLAGSPTSSP